MNKFCIGEEVHIYRGPFVGRKVLVLEVFSYRTKKDALIWNRWFDENPTCIGAPIMSYSGRRYRVRFDDGSITEILDKELEVLV